MQITDSKTVSNFADKDRSRSSGRKLQAWKTASENDARTAIYDNVSYLRSAGLFARTTKKLDTLKLCALWDPGWKGWILHRNPEPCGCTKPKAADFLGSSLRWHLGLEFRMCAPALHPEACPTPTFSWVLP